MTIRIPLPIINHLPLLRIVISKPRNACKQSLLSFWAPLQRQHRLTVDDLLARGAMDLKSDLFLNLELEDVRPCLDRIDNAVDTLKHGVGY